MSFTSVLRALDLLDAATVDGGRVAETVCAAGIAQVEVKRLRGDAGSTDVVRITMPGTQGRLEGGPSPTLGIVGRLGGLGARPEKIGLVSDADGAVTALACALELGRMAGAG